MLKQRFLYEVSKTCMRMFLKMVDATEIHLGLNKSLWCKNFRIKILGYTKILQESYKKCNENNRLLFHSVNVTFPIV